MRVLLDECVPRKLKAAITGHTVRTVPEMGWASKKNGELLRLMAGQFDVLLTVDSHLEEQQRLPENISVLVVITKYNLLAELLPLVPKILVALEKIQPGELAKVD